MEQLNEIEKNLVGNIPRGSESRISLVELTKRLGIDKRGIYSLISTVRLKGVPICADRSEKSKGYYIATTKEELARGISAYKAQLQDMNKLINSLEAVEL